MTPDDRKTEVDTTGRAAIVLVKLGDETQKPQLFACGKCGHVYSHRIYACNEALAIETARKAAEDCYNCRTHNVCQYCGGECGKNWTACDTCRRKKRFEKATQVSLDGVEQCFGFDGGNFYQTPEDAADDGEDWIYLSTFRPFEVEAWRVEEGVLDDHHEDASASDLKGLDKLLAAIKEFNNAQTSGSFDQDSTRIAKVSHLRDPEDAALSATRTTGDVT